MTQHPRFLLFAVIVILFGWAAQRRQAEWKSRFNSDDRLSDPSDLTPETTHQVSFFDQWCHKHDVYPFDCWTDAGYDPTRSKLPRDIQIVCAMSYGKSDIENGGFHQFFHNNTGCFAPEMIEWCERANLPDAANVIRHAMKKLFVGEYPRSQEERIRLLEKVAPSNDPRSFHYFRELDERFYQLLSEGTDFDFATDRWLRETCGINQLDDPPY